MNVPRLWKPGESFFILEIMPGGVSALLVGIDSEQRLVPRRFFEDTSWASLSKRPALRHLVKNVVIAADSSLAHTALVPVRLKRETPSRPLSAIELENLLAQEVGKAFSECRRAASRHLGVDELDVILVTSRVMNFKVDDHYVLNPLDFKAVSIEVMLELILTTRPVFEDIKSFARNKQDFFFTELTRSQANVLQKVRRPPFSILRLGETTSAFAVVTPAKVGQAITRGVFRWMTGGLLPVLEARWSVDRETAAMIYERFLRREVSPRFEKEMRALFASAEAAFSKALKEAQFKGPVAVESNMPLPWDMPFMKHGRTLAPPPLEELLERFGFHADLARWPFGREQAFRFLGPLWDFYYDRSDTTINRWLRRHLNWLGSSL